MIRYEGGSSRALIRTSDSNSGGMIIVNLEVICNGEVRNDTGWLEDSDEKIFGGYTAEHSKKEVVQTKCRCW